MASVEITVNGRPYKIGCEDGNEERLVRLARRFDAEVGKLSGQVGQIGDLRLMLMAGLVLCDSLEEAEKRAAAPQPAAAAKGRDRPGAAAAAIVARAAERIEALAGRVEEAAAEPQSSLFA